MSIGHNDQPPFSECAPDVADAKGTIFFRQTKADETRHRLLFLEVDVLFDVLDLAEQDIAPDECLSFPLK